MRAEVTDDQFLSFVERHPGEYHMRREISFQDDHDLTGVTFVWHPPAVEDVGGYAHSLRRTPDGIHVAVQHEAGVWSPV